MEAIFHHRFSGVWKPWDERILCFRGSSGRRASERIESLCFNFKFLLCPSVPWHFCESACDFQEGFLPTEFKTGVEMTQLCGRSLSTLRGGCAIMSNIAIYVMWKLCDHVRVLFYSRDLFRPGDTKIFPPAFNSWCSSSAIPERLRSYGLDNFLLWWYRNMFTSKAVGSAAEESLLQFVAVVLQTAS